ncbi:MAG: AAA family ATPase, partial [Gemmataceae bacterium]
RQLVDWFENDLDFYDMHRNPYSEDSVLSNFAKLLKNDLEFASIITRFLKDADIGIQELRVDDEKVAKHTINESDGRLEIQYVRRPALAFRHTTKDGSEVFFQRQNESSGTIRFVAMLVALLKPSTRRRVVCIDELSASMHPDLVHRLIKLAHSSDCNRSGNQLLFTTHDTHLMNPSELLRRDQITICTKDQFGSTTTRRLDEYQDSARSDANLQKQYLQGRFRGLPQFGPTLEDVPVDDQPMEVGLE